MGCVLSIRKVIGSENGDLVTRQKTPTQAFNTDSRGAIVLARCSRSPRPPHLARAPTFPHLRSDFPTVRSHSRRVQSDYAAARSDISPPRSAYAAPDCHYRAVDMHCAQDDSHCAAAICAYPPGRCLFSRPRSFCADALRRCRRRQQSC